MEQSKRSLSTHDALKNNIYISKFEGMTLAEYVHTRTLVCERCHKKPCHGCYRILKVAKEVTSKGFVKLRDAFELCSPGVKYSSFQARRMLLQMPLAVFGVGTLKEETFCLYLVEKCKPPNLFIMQTLITEATLHKSSTQKMTQDEMKKLLALAESESERKRLKYAVVKSAGMSNTKAKRVYGVSGVSDTKQKVEQAMEDACAIREAIENIAKVKDKAVLQSIGVRDDSDSDEAETMNTESETDTEDDVTEDQPLQAHQKDKTEDQPLQAHQKDKTDGGLPHQFQLKDFVNEEETYKHTTDTGAVFMNSHQLHDVLLRCDLNWFYFVRVLKDLLNVTAAALNQLLLDFSGQLHLVGFSDEEEQIIEQSRQAFLSNERLMENTRENNADVEVRSDSESSEAEIWAMGVESPIDERGKLLIKKRRAAIRRNSVREIKKRLAEKRLLKRRRSKKVGKIISECPGVGEAIEDFVKQCGAGADAWRRTGALTFDGNRKVKKKATFRRIKEHLEEKYGRSISYGSVVQLCCARNKRRRSAARYHGLANVVSKRARKGFNIRYNPDQHWSSSLYSALDKLQYKDGSNITNIGRDDQAGFRLDTMATHKLHATLCVKGSEHCTTRSDYVNKYPSTLQTTSYNFPSTGTTGEICAGIVKAPVLYKKNAAQHFCDLQMIEKQEEIRPAFINPITNERKEVECARVDGSYDEGPSHLEVEYWWTVRHLNTESRMELVTSRNSGASYKNRVELQNGCLSLAHANLFIPSTLNGSCLNSSGKVDEKLLSENLNSAIDVYISRVDKAPCAGTEIHLHRGADSADYQKQNELLKVFLKGSKAAKEKLKKDHPDDYAHFKQIWDVRESHLRKDLPLKYIFCLSCCYQEGCIHPKCKEGNPSEETSWYPGGPPLSFIPIPTADPKRCYGRQNCDECQGLCSGHYLKVEDLWQHVSNGGKVQAETPSTIILREFNRHHVIPEEGRLSEIAQEVLLSYEEVKMWFDHLSNIHENRKRGVEKAARTRKAKSKSQSKTVRAKSKKQQPTEQLVTTQPKEVCSSCLAEEPPGEEDIDWIACDSCADWFHAICVGLCNENVPDQWQCSSCVESWE